MTKDKIYRSIERLVVQTWRNTDYESGVDGERFFCEDATIVMPARTMHGRAEIIQGSKARLLRGSRLSRHLVNNLIVEISAPDKAVANYVLLLFAKDGTAPMYVTNYSAIGDVKDECVLRDGDWFINRRELSAAFLSPDNDSVMLVRPSIEPPAKSEENR